MTLPSKVFPPGDTLQEVLDLRSLSSVDLGLPGVEDVLRGGPLTQELAQELERVLGIEATFWNNLEMAYQTYLETHNLSREVGEVVCRNTRERHTPSPELLRERECPACGAPMKHEVRPSLVEYRAFKRLVPTRAWWCTRCPESVLEKEDLLKSEEVFQAIKQSQDDLRPCPNFLHWLETGEGDPWSE